jgi:hypothetical protein
MISDRSIVAVSTPAHIIFSRKKNVLNPMQIRNNEKKSARRDFEGL